VLNGTICWIRSSFKKYLHRHYGQSVQSSLQKRVPNHLELILKTLDPFRDQITGFVVESTYNWYWLVDGLMDAGYSSAHLANPSAIKQYEGLQHSDDQHDAFFLAQLLKHRKLKRKSLILLLILTKNFVVESQ